MIINKKYLIYLQIKDCIDVIEKETEKLSKRWELLNKYLNVLETEFGLTDEELDIPLGDLSNNEGSDKLLELIRKILNVEEVKQYD